MTTKTASKFLIANMQVGLERDIEPWLLPEDAYPDLQNFYIFRGRIRRKEGSNFLGRLNEATTQIAALGPNPLPNYAGPLAGAPITIDSVSFFIYDSAATIALLLQFFDQGETTPGSGTGTLIGQPGVAITNIANGNPTVITTSVPHNLQAGVTNSVTFQNVQGLVDTPTGNTINGLTFAATNTGASTFTIPLDTTTYTPYIPLTGTFHLQGTINYTTGAVSIPFPTLGGTAPYSLQARYDTGDYPCRPCMGIKTRELFGINAEETIFFDTVKANIYSQTASTMVDITYYKTTATAFSWTGSDSDFFWHTNYADAFWATNHIPGWHNSATATSLGDGIRWYDGDVPFTEGWVNFNPTVDSTNRLFGAKLIVPYFGRLVTFNTYEGPNAGPTPGVQFPQRARWCQIGTPYPATDPSGAASPIPQGYQGGTDDNAWRSDIAGKGGFVDAPTQEHIVSLGWYKDQLLIFFERSTWVFLYTGNVLQPFIWQRVHSEFGCESILSPVQFDTGVLAVGDKAIISATSTNVSRIDLKIPDEVFSFHNDNAGHRRVHGIRDYYREMVYWTYTADSPLAVFPNRMLAYNYRYGSFSIFKDCYTALGYLQLTDDLTWDNANDNWDDADFNWDGSPQQALYPQIVGGNNQGFISILLNQNCNDISQEIINIDTTDLDEVKVQLCGSHCLETGDFIKFQSVNGMNLAIVGEAVGTALAGSTSFTGTLSNLAITPTSVTITIGANIFTDPTGTGELTPNGGIINYENGQFTVYFGALAVDTPVTASYTQTINGRTFKIQLPTQFNGSQTVQDTIQLLDFDATGWNPYVDGGYIIVVDNVLLRTKRLNPFISLGKKVRFNFTDWLFDTTKNGEITLDVLYDQSSVPLPGANPITIRTRPENIVGSTLQAQSDKIWHRAFIDSFSDFIQFQITLSDEQMLDPDIQCEQVTFHGLLIDVDGVGRLV